MTAFIGRLAAMSLSGSALILMVLALSPLLRRRPALYDTVCMVAALRLLLPFAPAGQRVLRLCLAALPAPEGGFYLTAYRLAEFGAAQVVAFLWLFGACAVLAPPLWARFSGAAPEGGWLLLLVLGIHWFNPLVWRLNHIAAQARGQANGGKRQLRKGQPIC